MIQKITAESGAKIDIEDDGTIYISAENAACCDAAKKMIDTIVFVPEVGMLYYGKVVRILNFGAFVELAPGKDGMVHISKLAERRVEKVEDVVNIGDMVWVKVTDIDEKGRVNLSSGTPSGKSPPWKPGTPKNIKIDGSTSPMNQLWKAAGAAAWGAAALGGLQPFLGPEAAEQLHPLSRGPDRAGGGLSLLRRPGPRQSLPLLPGEDYHLVLGRRLEQVCAGLRARHPSHTFVAGADNSPVPELAAAELAGVGCRGRHGLRIVPPYGSYVFLGTILTDLVLPPPVRPRRPSARPTAGPVKRPAPPAP